MSFAPTPARDPFDDAISGYASSARRGLKGFFEANFYYMQPTERNDRFHNEHRNPRSDPRAPAKRDRDRLLYSNALRRLAGVTQVVSPSEGVVVHNRLTHTLKVAQIARRLSERLVSETDEELVAAAGGLDPEVAEAASLAHDLGHPPFGHIGETELNQLVTDGKKDEEGYEGNAQSFRIVTRLAVRSNEHAGLNLTRATLNAILKYPWLHANRPNNKWGAYSTEKDEFFWVRAADGEFRSLEADIMDWSDDITYAVHDVDDFYRAGIVPLNLIVKDSDERGRFLTGVHDRWTKTHPNRAQDWQRYQDAFQNILTLMPIRGPYAGTRKEQALLNSLGSELITRFIQAPQIDKECPCKLKIPGHIDAQVTMLKQLNWHYVIECSALKTQQHGYRRIVGELFQIYKQPEAEQLLPSWLSAEVDRNAPPTRRAADIVSCLSDSQAIGMYQRLTGLSPGSIRDWS